MSIIEQAKAKAKEIQKETGKQYAECLRIVAAENGFKNWEGFQAKASDEPTPNAGYISVGSGLYAVASAKEIANYHAVNPIYVVIGAEKETLELADMIHTENSRDIPYADKSAFLRKENKPRAIEIGKALNELGGSSLMMGVFEALRRSFQFETNYLRDLELAWDGIGEWRG